MKRFYVMDFGEDLIIHYDAQDKERTPLCINEVAKLLNEQQEEIRKLKFQLCEMRLASVVLCGTKENKCSTQDHLGD